MSSCEPKLHRTFVSTNTGAGDFGARDFGARLRSARIQAGLDVRDVAGRSLGRLSPSAVTSYERGERDLRLSKLLLLCAILSISPDTLFDRTEPPHRLVVDIAALQRSPAHIAAPLLRFITDIARRRGVPVAGDMALRMSDLETLAFAYGESSEALVTKLADWAILRPGPDPLRAC